MPVKRPHTPDNMAADAYTEKRFYLKNISETKLTTNEKPRVETVFKTKSKKDKSDCLNIRKTLLGTSPKLVILKSAEDLCIKGFDSVKKHKPERIPGEPRVGERLLTVASDGSVSQQSTPEPPQPTKRKSFCCKYLDDVQKYKITVICRNVYQESSGWARDS